jgi:hypothetical protein
MGIHNLPPENWVKAREWEELKVNFFKFGSDVKIKPSSNNNIMDFKAHIIVQKLEDHITSNQLDQKNSQILISHLKLTQYDLLCDGTLVRTDS